MTALTTKMFFVSATDSNNDDVSVFVEAEDPYQALVLWKMWLEEFYGYLPIIEDIPEYKVFELPPLNNESRFIPWHTEDGVKERTV